MLARAALGDQPPRACADAGNRRCTQCAQIPMRNVIPSQSFSFKRKCLISSARESL